MYFDQQNSMNAMLHSMAIVTNLLMISAFFKHVKIEGWQCFEPKATRKEGLAVIYRIL